MEVVENVQGLLHDPVGLLDLPNAHGLGSTVLGAGRRGPDKVEVVRGEGVLVVPIQNIAVYVRRQVPVQGDDLPAVILEDTAHGARAGEEFEHPHGCQTIV